MLSLREGLEGGAKIFAILAVAFGVFTYFYDQAENRRLRKVDRAIAGVGDLYSTESLKHFANIAAHYGPLMKVIKNASADDLTKFHYFVLTKRDNYSSLKSSFFRLFNDYDLIAQCAEKELCDRDIVVYHVCFDYTTLSTVGRLVLSDLRDEGLSAGSFAEKYFHENC